MVCFNSEECREEGAFPRGNLSTRGAAEGGKGELGGCPCWRVFLLRGDGLDWEWGRDGERQGEGGEEGGKERRLLSFELLGGMLLTLSLTPNKDLLNEEKWVIYVSYWPSHGFL